MLRMIMYFSTGILALVSLPVFSDEFDLPDLQAVQVIDSLEVESQRVDNSKFKFLISAGYVADFEKQVDGLAYEHQPSGAILAGFEFGKMQYSLEYYNRKQNTQAGNLRISTSRDNLNFNLFYVPDFESRWSPKLGVYGGLYRDNVETHFSNSSVSAESEVLLLIGAKAGVQYTFQKVLFTEFLLKVAKRETSEEFEFGGLVAVGFRFAP